MWLNRLASVRGGGSRPACAPSAEEASSSTAAPPAAAAAPSPSSQAKAEAAKKYIENMYKERGKVALDRLERRRSLDSSGTAVRRPARPQRPALASCAADAKTPRQLTEEERTAALAELQRRETEYTRLRRQKLTVEDFEPLTIIGRGAFGEVRPARRRRVPRAHDPNKQPVAHLPPPRAPPAGPHRARARHGQRVCDEEAEKERDGSPGTGVCPAWRRHRPLALRRGANARHANRAAARALPTTPGSRADALPRPPAAPSRTRRVRRLTT